METQHICANPGCDGGRSPPKILKHDNLKCSRCNTLLCNRCRIIIGNKCNCGDLYTNHHKFHESSKEMYILCFSCYDKHKSTNNEKDIGDDYRINILI